MKRSASVVAVLLSVLGAGSASAARFAVADQTSYSFPLLQGAIITLDNPSGNIEIIGSDTTKAEISAQKVIRGANEASFSEARQQTQIVIGGNERLLSIRTSITPRAGATWTSAVNYSIRLPRSAQLRLNTRSSESIRITNIEGSVGIANVSGIIRLQNVTGEVVVESINGSILFDSPSPPRANVRLTTVNGNVEMSAVPNASFNWVAESIRGDYRTTFPVNGRKVGPRFEAVINAAGGPTIRTSSAMGSVFLLRRGTRQDQAQQIVGNVRAEASATPPPDPSAARRKLVLRRVDGNFFFSTNVGDVAIEEVGGDLKVRTGAGDVALGSVGGFAEVLSLGGPLRFGEVAGFLRAETKAGDINVQAARKGGSLITGGGIIRLAYAGGPMRLHSGGGDILVRRANGPLSAETRSGDINITMDAGSKSDRVTARTAKGSVAFNISSRFGADIDATVLTSDPEANNIVTDLPGLSIQREQVGGKTRIRATGKVNGGGERVDLFAEDGGIQIMQNVPQAASLPANR